MNIAICDDEQKELAHLQSLVKEYDSSIDTSLFPSAESFLGAVKERHYDIILLDIEMDGMNGFAAAKKLADMQNPPLVVFVTNSAEYTYRGYEVAFRYLPKPVSFAVLADVLSAAIAKIVPHKFTLTQGGRTHIIQVCDILYFETSGHRLLVRTKKNEFECRMKLSEAEALLPKNSFASPHKSYLVNLDFVDTVSENELSLICNVQIPISRRRKQEFEKALSRFVRRH